MVYIEDAFVVLHIRISHIKFFKFSLRSHILTYLLILVIFHLYQIYIAKTPAVFLQAGFFAIFFLMASLFWVKTWLKANKILNATISKEKHPDFGTNNRLKL